MKNKFSLFIITKVYGGMGWCMWKFIKMNFGLGHGLSETAVCQALG